MIGKPAGPPSSIGAVWCGKGVTEFTVWAPAHASVRVVLESRAAGRERSEALAPLQDGYFHASVSDTAPGDLYRYELPGGGRYPDPASRFQPLGPHGPSQIVDPHAFAWTDGEWAGLQLSRQVLYEMHVGTFTPEGTWRAAWQELPRLADFGITAVELMPVADFAGDRGWGYDGVDLFAPTRLYGTPDELRQFVNEAHKVGIGVILDVVYNHLGPDGNYLGTFSPHYFTARHANEWGDAINYDGPGSKPVRDFMAANAEYWIADFHLDGLRFDATQQIFDDSPVHVLAELTTRARRAAGGRSILLIAENESQDARTILPVERGGFGFDAVWNDDFHHTLLVALTGQREAYYTDYTGAPQEFVSLVKWGYLFQGQRYSWQKARRGSPCLGAAARRFVTFIENHDQVANGPNGRGERPHQRSSPGLYRALTGFWLLAPGTPMFFQGQECGAPEPFMFFAGHEGALGEAVRQGRAEFMSQFRSAATLVLADTLPDPQDRSTFERCHLIQVDGRASSPMARLHRDLLRLRRDDPVIGCPDAGLVEGAVIGDRAFLIRWFQSVPRDGDPEAVATRLLVVNLGAELRLDPAPEPLLAPAWRGAAWGLLWSSEHPDYGGAGTAPLDTDDNWRLPAQSAVVLQPVAHADSETD